MEISTKKQLAIFLSKLKGFERPKTHLEQYSTESDFAAEIAWNAFYRREIEGKTVADLGCGTGILGISMLLSGAKKVFFIDIDEESLAIAKENVAFAEEILDIELMDNAVFVAQDISNVDEKVDIVIQNPPFGIQGKTHADREFLEAAFRIGKVIYSFHKMESGKFIRSIAKDNGFIINGYWEFDWPLKQTMKHHKKRIQYVKVGCWRMEKHS